MLFQAEGRGERVIADSESPAERTSRDVNGPSEGGEMRRLRGVSVAKFQTRMSTATDRGFCRGALPAAQPTHQAAVDAQRSCQRRGSMNQPKAYATTASQMESSIPMREPAQGLWINWVECRLGCS
jgi:hypothetical protein